MLLLALFSIGFTASSDDKNGTDVPVQPTEEESVQGIVELNSNIGDWNAAYLTNSGYFLYSKSVDKDTESMYSSLTYMSKDGKDLLSLISTAADNLPTQMVINEKGVVYFSFPNDSIVEIVYDNGSKVELLGSFKFLKANLPSISQLIKSDVLKSVLANVSAIIKANGPASSTIGILINRLATMFENVSNMNYEDNAEAVAELAKGSTGNYAFSETVNKWYTVQIGSVVFNKLSIWTGEATYKVGGSSCTLSGTIWCPSNVYNDYGTYGILCDADPEKLQVGLAEYDGTGYQGPDDLSYDVDFRGFKPNTTYYYRAYYKFNSSDHGHIYVNYGDNTAPVIYDTTIKSFTTGDNSLFVDVAMCIDVTGSMSGLINTVKKNAISFYDSFKSACEKSDITLSGLNAQVIAFRDKNVDYNWLETSSTFSLPAQKTEFDSFVNSLYASGGGDAPESGLEALEKAFKKTDWGIDDGYHRHVVILWTDVTYLVGSAYTDLTVEALEPVWNSMPSGRRLIIFAPTGKDYYSSNGGSWDKLDGWKNVIHEDDLTSGFNNFDYILESIIGELTSKAKSRSCVAPTSKDNSIFFRPNN